MKATDMLKKQHRQVKALFKRIEKAEDASERRQLMDDVAHQLQVHTKLEEEIFYPAVRGIGSRKAQKIVDEALEEHHVIDLILQELPRINPEDERFEAKMTVLSELVEDHVEGEEEEMFKLADRLGDEELTDLGGRMQQQETRRAA